MRHALFMLMGLILAVAPAGAQDEPSTHVITIVGADDIVGEVVDGERLQRLLGNVHLRQDDTDLLANRATQFLDRDLTIFEGNVRIYDDTDTLRAVQVSYDSRTRVGEARGDVRLSDAEAVLYSDSLVYFRAEKRAVFDAPVRLIERDGGGVLTSRRGTYFTERKEAFFEDDVRLQDDTSVLTSRRGRYGTEDKRADFSGVVHLTHERSTRLRADSLTHFRDTRISEARGNVAILRFGGEDGEAPPDTSRRTLMFGGYAFHDEDGNYSRVERGGQPVEPLIARLTIRDNGVTDTLLVRAATFEAMQPDTLDAGPLPPGASLQRVIGVGTVRMAGEQLAASADSVVVDRIEFDEALGLPPEDDVRFYREPFAWLNSRGSTLYTQISGETLRLTARGEAADSLWALGRAFAVRPDSALERNNQIRGRSMVALFRQDSLRAIRVWPNAEAIFFRADSLGALQGAITLSADSLSFNFEGDDLRRMGGVRDIEGTYYDAHLIPSPFRLEGPAFAPQDRPTIADLLTDRPPLVDPFATLPDLPELDLPEIPIDDVPPGDPFDPDELPEVDSIVAPDDMPEPGG